MCPNSSTVKIIIQKFKSTGLIIDVKYDTYHLVTVPFFIERIGIIQDDYIISG